MRRPLTAAIVVFAGVLGMGALLGQLGRAQPTFAAGSPQKHTAKTHKSSTTKKSSAASTKKSSTASAKKSSTVKKSAATSATRKNAAGKSSTPHADGTVVTVSGNNITVKADADPAGSTEYTGVTTIQVNTATKYDASGGTTTTTMPTIAAGQRISAEGTVSSDGKTLIATLVSTGTGDPRGPGHSGGPGGGGPHADGTVISFSGDTIMIKADADPTGSTEYTKVTTIKVTSTTTYDSGPGTSSTTTPAITAGQYIVAEGTLSPDGLTLIATRVDVHTGGPGH
jgi:hypothetical protein